MLLYGSGMMMKRTRLLAKISLIMLNSEGLNL